MAANKENTEVKQGAVIEALPDTRFRVQLDEGSVVLGYLSGKMRKYRIKVLVGDKVKVEFSPYDQTKGRIIQRM